MPVGFETETPPKSRELDRAPRQEVVIRDVRMRFGSMVVFMVKWALASIPTLIILVSISVLAAGISTGVLASFVGMSHVLTSGSNQAAAKAHDPMQDLRIDGWQLTMGESGT